MTAPKFRGERSQTTVRVRIDNGTPEPCLYEIGERQFIPTSAEVRFGDGITTVYVSGPRVARPCNCDCHPKRDMDDADYGTTYYPGNAEKAPPAWIWKWAQRAMAGVR